MVAIVTASRTTNMFNDSDGDGKVTPGDTLISHILLNNGTAPIANVSVTDTFLSHTTFVPGTVVLTVGDAYGNIAGNTPISYSAGLGLLANDKHVDGASSGTNTGLSVVNVNGTGIGGAITIHDAANAAVNAGTVDVAANGSFSFTPATGYLGIAAFTYQTSDGSGIVGTGTVNLTVNSDTWYVDSNASGVQDGSYLHPFQATTSVGAVDHAGDTIFVYNRGASYAGNITLKNGESLYGDGHAYIVNGLTISDGTHGNSTLTAGTGTVVTLGSGNNIGGVTLTGTGTAGGLDGTNFGTLNVDHTSIGTATGQILSLTNGAIDNFTGGVSFTSLSSSGTAAGSAAIVLSNIDNAGTGAHVGTFNAAGVTIAGAAGHGIEIDGGSSATFNFNGSTGIAGAAGDAVHIDGASTAGDGAVTIGNLTVTGTTGNGVSIANDTGAVTVTAGSIANTTGAGSDGVHIAGGAADVMIGASIAKSSSGNPIDVSGHTGGTLTFSGGVTANGTANGVTLSSNTGATIDISGGMTLNTSGSNTTAFSATGGGTVNVTGTNTANGGQGSAIVIQNTTIGASNVTFQSAASSGGSATGIIVDTTGATGGLHITGTGSANSGGTIATKTGADGATTTGIGIYLNNTHDVQLSSMNLHDFQNFGIFGNSVNGFVLSNSTVTATGAATNGTLWSSGTTSEGSVTLKELTGTATISNTTISKGITTDLNILNTATGTLNLTVSGSTFTGQGDNTTATPTVQEVLLQGGVNVSDNPTINATFTNNTFTNNDARAIQAVANGAATMSIQVGKTAAGTGNTFNGMPAAMLDIAHNSTGNFDFNVKNNTFTLGSVGAQVGAGVPINIFNGVASGSATVFQGTISGNTITGQNNSGFDGITLNNSGPGTMTAVVTNNTITNVAGRGIDYGGAQNASANTANLTITNNTITMPDPNASFGIQVDAMASSGTGSGTVNLTLTGNNVVNDAASPDYRVDALKTGATINMPGYTGGSQDTTTSATGVRAFIGANNQTNGVTSSSAEVSASVGLGNLGHFGNTPGGAAVTTPNNPQPLQVTQLGSPDTPVGDKPLDNQVVVTDPAPAGSPTPVTPTDVATPPATPIVNDGILTQAEVNFLVDAAIARWAAAGATADQIAAMKAVSVTISDITGLQVGDATPGHIQVDSDAGGYGWFLDSAPADDAEFHGTGTDLAANAGGAADHHIDLLTVLMHELGHQIGLEDDYLTADSADIMYGYINPSERRLPTSADAAAATGNPIAHEAFALTPVALGTVPVNTSYDISFRQTVDPFAAGLAPSLTATSTVTYDPVQTKTATDTISSTGETRTDSGGAVTASTLAVATLTLGDQVFLDVNKNGVFNSGTDTGVVGVTMKLYADSNGNGVLDGAELTTVIATATTGANGIYSFTGLAPGDYVVSLDASNFTGGGALVGKVNTAGGTDPDDNVDNDDNGIAGPGGTIISAPIRLDYNSEPTAGIGNNTNNTLDFGFFTPNTAPTSTNFNGDIAGYIEGAAPVRLDVGGNATLADSTNTNFNGGTLTVHIGTGAAAGEDVLGFSTSGTTVTMSSGTAVGSIVSVGGVAVGTVTSNGSGGNDLALALNTVNATPANVQILLRALQYNDTNLVDPSTTTRAVSVTLVDGGGNDGGAGADTLVINTQVTVTGVNDEPSGADNGNTTVDNVNLVFSAADFSTGFTDPDHNNFAGVKITTLPSTGTIKLNGSAILAGADVTLAQLNAGNLTYTPPGVGSGGTSPTFTFQVRDDGGVLNGGVDLDQSPNTFTVTITASDAPPVIDLNGAAGGIDNTAAYAEQAAPTVLASALTVTDADTVNIASARVSVGTGFIANQDYLTVNGGTNGTISGITFAYNAATGVLTLTGSATLATYQGVLAQVGFESTSDAPGTSRVINWTVNDGTVDSTIAKTTVTVTPVNDPPSGADATITATEDTPRILVQSDFGFTDPDGDAMSAVTITAVTGGKLYFDADGTAGAGAPVEVTTPQTYTAADLAAGKVSYQGNLNVNGNGAGSISFQVIDNSGAGNDTDPVANTLTVNITAVDDPPVAQPDAVATAENAVLNGNVFNDNGSGADSDVDGPPLAVSAVNGSGANVGATITLASGAKLTLNANGTFSYDPNGKFNHLTSTAGGETGAVNTSAPDSFQYTLAGGNTVTVTVTVNGVASADDWLVGNSGDNVITGTGNGDFFMLQQGGNDSATGLGGNDIFLFGATLTSADNVDGGGGIDQIAIQGNYTAGNALTLGTGVVNVESLAILPGSDTRFGDPGTNSYSYDVTTLDVNVAAGAQLVVDANRLRVGESFTFNGAAETDGSFFIYGGMGTDHLTGGAKNDVFYFGENLQFGASDTVNGGPGGTDQLALRGDYSGANAITFGAGQLTSIENIGMVSAHDTRFGPLGSHYNYDLTMNDGNVAAGQRMTVDAALLRSDETLHFNGSAELDGSFRVFGGAGNDVITGSHGADILSGGLGADTLTGGAGNDTFLYRNVAESTPAGRDGIQDFSTGDIIDLSQIDGDTTLAGKQSFHFVNGGAFTSHAGELIAVDTAGPIWTVSGDVNGDGVADFQVVVTTDHVLTAADFHL
jgi:hypothetical protein